ncbi:segregation and condensation protein A [Ferrimonas senticii]|uniref:segregation and condensation protein A n=1 Tax=Ferrimonas senticii TaxID=394566 RepID=UPI0004089F2E|nr:segregation/condensation protein A [Ferrimonas senticii]
MATVVPMRPRAIVQGKPLKQFPADLFIPPDALEVFLESFEGPLDLLLYLIRKQKLDILDLPIVTITAQYMEYIALMEAMKFELAAEYLVMAATLAEIKSRLLLPRPVFEEDDEIDPRALLVKQLQAYEMVKKAAADLDALPRQERDNWRARATAPESLQPQVQQAVLSMSELLGALQGVIARAEHFEHHHIAKETLSTRERMSRILAQLSSSQFTPFEALFSVDEGRAGVVVTLLAVLELVKEQLIELQQQQIAGPIVVRAKV